MGTLPNELFIGFHPGYDEDNAMDRIEATIDRDDIEGIMLPFAQGVSIFIHDAPEDLDVEAYKAHVTAALTAEFGDEMSMPPQFIHRGETPECD
ncbi:hypothetical protein NVP1081O_118 [Vibrio phage 1.081.O._10N.286.52.C2]|nr:hypothetical protein NVP1081O_118 [Vibrio phage 1.081.O._10N.286.52.C2]